MPIIAKLFQALVRIIKYYCQELPSSGLHYFIITGLIQILRKIRANHVARLRISSITWDQICQEFYHIIMNAMHLYQKSSNLVILLNFSIDSSTAGQDHKVKSWISSFTRDQKCSIMISNAKKYCSQVLKLLVGFKQSLSTFIPNENSKILETQQRGWLEFFQ